jgi:phosphoribosylformylglycinamidine synthase subunit PurL
MPATAPDVYLSLGISHEEFAEIVQLLGREPSDTELGMFSVQWSEHCSYKCSRPVLAYFRQYKEAIEGDGLENAGIVDIGDGLGVAMKVESHNHPSAVEPYQGAATGVGGIIRDILTMGARPIACLDSLRFGPIRDGEGEPAVVARNRYLFEHVVAGIGGYGNCVGVPTVGGEVGFHPRYSGNPLVNAMCVGILPLKDLTTASASGIGNPVLYLGSATGRDGIHGASFASDVLDEDSEAKRPNVQIGDPFAEKSLIEATLEALATGAIVAIQDMGAAGLTCSTTEMAAKGGVGMDIDLDRVPMREPDMSAYELMLSESQERMLCVAEAGREHEVIDVFRKWGLHAVVVGRVTDSGQIRVWRGGLLAVDAPAKAFTDACPVRRLQGHEPTEFAARLDWSPDALPEADPEQSLLSLLAWPEIASKRWVFRQYDSQVQTQTTLLPGQADAAVLAPRCTERGIAVSLDGNSRWVAADPYVGGQLAVCEAALNVACTGAVPRAATDGLNFGSPLQPHVFWQFDRSVKGIAEAAEALGTPVLSGNVSFYNESELGEVPPTPMVGVLGVIDRAVDRVGTAPPDGPFEVWAVWTDLAEVRQQGLGASAFMAEVHGLEPGVPVAPDLSAQVELHAALADWAAERRLLFAHDASDGGLAVALAELVLAAGVGIEVDLESVGGLGPRTESVLFGERPGLVLVGIRPGDRIAAPRGLTLRRIGSRAVTPSLTVNIGGRRVVELPVDRLKAAYEGAIPAALSV